MTLIVCVDDRMGMAFLSRRQSRDSNLTGDIAKFADGRPISMHPRSARLFRDIDCTVRAEADFLASADRESICFLEFSDPAPALRRADTLIIYRWNRRYPADLYFTSDLADWTLVETADFPGASHEKITREVYTREKAY